jgi:hypothetical protein
MDDKFKPLIEGLHKKHEALIAMPPVTIATAPNGGPVGGAYLFLEKGIPLYAGRTKRRIRTRLKEHGGTATDGPFAWHLVRAKTGSTRAPYTKEGSRHHLLSQPGFKRAYEEAKTQIRKMDARFVGEPDPLKQALLEIYVAVVPWAKFNDFDTHGKNMANQQMEHTLTQRK